MAQIVFPPNPNVGDTVTGEYGEVYTWDGVKWTITPGTGGGGGGAAIELGEDPPIDPVDGMLWWNTDNSKLYLWDSAQWVVVVNTPEGGDVPAADLISTDADNALTLGSDDLLYVPESGGGGGESTVGQYMSVGPTIVNWGASGDTNTLVNLVLPAGDWDADGACNFTAVTSPMTITEARLQWNGVNVSSQIVTPNVPWGSTIGPTQYMAAINLIRLQGPGTLTLLARMSYPPPDFGTPFVQGFLRARRWDGASGGGGGGGGPPFNGVTDGSDAAPGQIGEFVTTGQQTFGGFTADGTGAVVNSLALSAGDWEVSGTIAFLTFADEPPFNIRITAGLSPRLVAANQLVCYSTIVPQFDAPNTPTFPVIPTRFSSAAAGTINMVVALEVDSGRTTGRSGFSIITARRVR